MTDTALWRATARADWPILPLKAVAGYVVSSVDKLVSEDEQPVRLCNYTDVYKNDHIHPDMDLMAATASESEIERFRLQVGDVVITKDSETWDDIGVPALVVETADDLVCGYHLAVIRPFADTLNGRFLFRCLQARCIRLHLELSSTGVTRFGLPKEEIGHVLLPLPPLSEQTRIADYLDAETARIDALVAEKERMLELLEEKRAALVSHAVTRGLNPDAPMKPSGLDWLGDIPAHWQVRRLKHLAEVRGGLTLGKQYTSDEFEEYPYLRVANVQDGYIDLNIVTTIMVPAREAALYRLQAGDVLMNEGGDEDKLGRGAIWDGRIAPCLHQNHVFCVRPFGVSSEWLDNWTAAAPAKHYFQSRAKRATNLASISATNIKEMPVLLPPPDEQAAILAHLDAERARTAALESALRDSIELLTERRAALIAAAVTGQLALGEA